MFLHKKRIIHHELKPGNVLATKDNQIKICDFRVARSLSQDSYASTIVGTHNYQTSEVIQSQSYSYPADAWESGCILYELTTRKQAFPEKDIYTLSHKIFHENPQPIT